MFDALSAARRSLRLRKNLLSLLVQTHANARDEAVIAEDAVQQHQQREEEVEDEEEGHVAEVQQHRQPRDSNQPNSPALHAAVPRTMQEGVMR